MIVGSLAGGVGSGILLPIAFLSREALGKQARVDGFALLPSLFPLVGSALHSRLYANTYAAQAELEQLKAAGAESPFHDLCLVSDETVGDTHDPFSWLAEYILREVLQQGAYLYRAPSGIILPSLAKDILVVNDELLAYLKTHPAVLYELPSRKFEEVVAAVLGGLGYEVVLTKRSRDGGKDLYALHRSDLGEQLYIVECKRYGPDRPVGVDVVRSLYGVVQQERATMGIVATTSYFTTEALEFRRVVKYGLSLKGYQDLLSWLERYFSLKGPRYDRAGR